MKIQWKNLITCLAAPLAVVSLSSLLTRNSMNILMGIASYLVLTSGNPFIY